MLSFGSSSSHCLRHLENKCMHFNCAIQSPGHNHSWYTTSWSHLCLSFAPPSPYVGCMSCFSPWICAARVPAGLVSFANSALYLRLKEINTRSASQNHSNTSTALANKTTGKRAALPVCAQQQACLLLSGVQANPSPSKPRLTDGPGQLLFPSQTPLILQESLFSTHHPLPAATGPGNCSHRHSTVHGKQ